MYILNHISFEARIRLYIISSIILSIFLIIIPTSDIISSTEKNKHPCLFLKSGPNKSKGSELKDKNFKKMIDIFPAAKRYRIVHINPLFLTPEGLSPGDRIYLPLFQDVNYWVTIQNIFLDVNNVLAIRGLVEDTEGGYFILSAFKGKVEASLHIPQRKEEYALSYVNDISRHVLREVDVRQKDILPEGPTQIPPSKPEDK